MFRAIKTKIFKDTNEDGVLSFIDKGICQAYIPKILEGSEDKIDPHITFKMGKYRLQFDKQDFIDFCKMVMNNKLLGSGD